MKKLFLILLTVLFSFTVYSKERPTKTVYEGEAIVSTIDFDAVENMSDRELMHYLYENSNMIRPIKIEPQDTIRKEMSNYEKYRMEQEKVRYGQDIQDEEVFMVVEDMPTFKGKDAKEFRKYIAENVIYPDIAVENGITGKVIVSFVVNKDGRVVNAEIEESIDPSLDKEAIRVVESSPKWKPGEQRGKAVNVQFTFPINFVLQEETEQTTVVNNYYIDNNDYDWQFRMNRRLYFGHSYYNPYYNDPYYYGGYYGYPSYGSWYGGYYNYEAYYGSYYPYYGNHYNRYYNHNRYYPNYRYNNGNGRYTASLGSRRYYNSPYTKTYSNGYINNPYTASKKSPYNAYTRSSTSISKPTATINRKSEPVERLNKNMSTRSLNQNRTYTGNNTNKNGVEVQRQNRNTTTVRTTRVTPNSRNKSPYTRVLQDGSKTTKTYTPNYSKPRTSSKPSYNTPTRTQQRTTTVKRSTQPSRSANYNRPSSTTRSSSTYSRPSSSSKNYSTPSRSSSSYKSSAPARSSSSYSSGRSSSSSRSSYSSGSSSRSSGSATRSSSGGSRSGGKK